MNRWTEEQKQAIETTGKNILVSAAAGSGKTTVLVERIKNLVINKKVGIDRFLITTFTKAAAAEMKERLEKAIRNELKDPKADKYLLLKQLQQLPEANISTFHSFAIEIIRQYFYLTDLEPGFGIADDIQTAIMKKKAMDSVFSRRYEERTDEFRAFILKYGSASGDDALKDNILEIYKTLVSIPDYRGWMHAKADKLKGASPMMELGGFHILSAMTADRLLKAVRKYEQAASAAENMRLAKVYEAASEDAEIVRQLAVYADRLSEKSDDEIRDTILGLSEKISSTELNRLPYAADKADEDVKKAITQMRTAGKKYLKEAVDIISKRDFKDIDKELKDIYSDTKYLIGIIEEFTDAFREVKAEEKVIDFDDVMHYALSVLEHDEAAAELREKFLYIFIDEYQDSNYLQEEIISRITRGDNLFMVGDVKQCIYKFRLAEPELFRERARRYACGEEGDRSILLNLNSNFRSKINVTEPVNDLFRQVMEGYDKGAELRSKAPEEYPGFPARIHIINKEEFDENSPAKNDAEGAVIADIIRERLGSMVYDTKLGRTRPLRFRDFAVITRNNREVEDLERYLVNEGIAAYGEGSGRYFETVEVQVFLNLLRVVDNMRQDVPLISVMRSVVFGFTTAELVDIRISGRDGSFYSAVVRYAENGQDGRLRSKLSSMIEKIDLWKEISRTVPLDELMKILLYDTGYYDYCSGLPVGIQRISNLRLIAEKAAKFENISHGGLFGFLKYIESMKDAGESDAEAKVVSENEDVVRVMSVHKSKGLEFSVVIFANAAKKTSAGGSRYAISIHRDFGIGLPTVNREGHWHRKTFLQKSIDYVKEREKIEEEIRILYVALTRAKDGFEIVGTIKKEENIPDTISTETFLDMMYVPLSEREETEIVVYSNPMELEKSNNERMRTADELFEEAREMYIQNQGITDSRISARLAFEYPYGEEKNIKSKYSVSELNRRGRDIEIPIADFEPDVNKRTLSAAEKGIVMHLLMEKLDFGDAIHIGTEYIQETADRLLADGTINTLEYDSISVESAWKFFCGDVGKRAAAACSTGQMSKEQEFILSKEMDGVSTVVQGVIDCFFEENGELILIDYKNSYVGQGRSASEIAQDYKNQIFLYKEALEGATGKRVRESYIFLFDTGEFVRI